MSSLLTAAGATPPSRSSSAVIAKPTRGFHVFRIDGYSVTTTLPAGERVTSQPFYIGGRRWLIDYYPNSTDASAATDSDAISVYLRLQGTHVKQRVRAEYKFGLLDPTGAGAYELPAETGIFSSTGGGYDSDDEDAGGGNPVCGYASFVTKEDLGRRRESLLKEDSLAIRCDIAVAQLEAIAATRKLWPPPPPVRRSLSPRVRRRGSYDSCGSESPDEYDDGPSHDNGGRRRQRAPPDDKEYIRRCLTAQRRRKY
ncbi:unnamed protein product [Urochloa decumbens]|uniref:MATH domain-containing protein n=1 Tax=Urochloa decumbens TaxID=240449 RepID=A0ABC9BUB5_9POAL